MRVAAPGAGSFGPLQKVAAVNSCANRGWHGQSGSLAGGTATAGEQAATRIVAVNGERHQQRQEAQHDAGSERVEPAMDRLPALVPCALDAGLSKGTQLTPCPPESRLADVTEASVSGSAGQSSS